MVGQANAFLAYVLETLNLRREELREPAKVPIKTVAEIGGRAMAIKLMLEGKGAAASGVIDPSKLSYQQIVALDEELTRRLNGTAHEPDDA